MLQASSSFDAICAMHLDPEDFHSHPFCWLALTCVPISLGPHLRDEFTHLISVSDVMVFTPLLRVDRVLTSATYVEEFSTEIAPSVRFAPLWRHLLLESGSPGVSGPQHLPPLGFRNPPTVCSSNKLARLISYEHHLWGSKCKRAWLLDSVPERVPEFNEVHPETFLGTNRDTLDMQPAEAICLRRHR